MAKTKKAIIKKATIKKRIKFFNISFWKYDPADKAAGLKQSQCRLEPVDPLTLLSHVHGLDFESRRKFIPDHSQAKYIRIADALSGSLAFPVAGKIATIRYTGMPEKINSDEIINNLEIGEDEGLIDTSHFVIFREKSINEDAESPYYYVLGLEYNHHAPGQVALSNFIRDLCQPNVDGISPIGLIWPELDRKLDLIIQKGLCNIEVSMASGTEHILEPLDANFARSVASAFQFAPSKRVKVGITGIASDQSSTIVNQIRRYFGRLNESEKKAIDKFVLESKKVDGQEESIDMTSAFMYSNEQMITINNKTKAVDDSDAWLKIRGAYTEWQSTVRTAVRNLRDNDT